MIEVLTHNSVESLRESLPGDPSLLGLSFDELMVRLKLELAPSYFDIDVAKIHMRLPDGNQKFDKENCLQLWAHSSNLIVPQALDERLWVTLCIRDFSDYCQTRWTKASNTTSENHIRNHWFASFTRDFWRNNTISRLWWHAYLASRVVAANGQYKLEQVLDILFENSNYINDLFGRPSSVLSANVLTAIIEITDKAYQNNIRFHIPAFRAFMKEVDFRGGRTVLPSLSKEALIELLEPIYLKCHDIHA